MGITGGGAAGAKAWTVSRGGPFGEAGAQL